MTAFNMTVVRNYRRNSNKTPTSFRTRRGRPPTVNSDSRHATADALPRTQLCVRTLKPVSVRAGSLLRYTTADVGRRAIASTTVVATGTVITVIYSGENAGYGVRKEFNEKKNTRVICLLRANRNTF